MITTSVWTVLLLLPLIHTIADFELQTDEMAINKSKSLKWLSLHVLAYSSLFTLVFGLLFGLVTFCTHFITDFFTSRWSRSKFPWLPQEKLSAQHGITLYQDFEGWNGRSRHRFFCVIGWDQLIHTYTLVATVIWLKPQILGWLF